MASTRWRKGVSVIEHLQRQPYSYDFFQAVRLLESSTLCEKKARLVSGSMPMTSSEANELVRFSSNSTLSFSANDIDSITKIQVGDRGQSNQQWLLSSGFMGLSGSHGVMPYHLSEQILKQVREKNYALIDFLDIFNHRILSLFYKAWSKYRLPVNYEKQKLVQSVEKDSISYAIASLIGLGTEGLDKSLLIPQDAMLGFAGSLSRGICTASSLESMLSRYFDIDATIEQFQGTWYELPEDIQTRMPGGIWGKGRNNRLGKNAVIGSRAYQLQSKFLIKIAPMPYEDFMTYLPGEKKLEELKQMVSFAVGDELDFEILITVYSVDMPSAQLLQDDHYQPRLGWNTPMNTQQSKDSVIDILLSKDTIAIEDISSPMNHHL